MKKTLVLLLILSLFLSNCKKEEKKETIESDVLIENTSDALVKSALEIIPISHATMVLNYDNETIYVDPTGGKQAFTGQKKPSLVLITDIHGDHYNINTLKDLDLNGTLIKQLLINFLKILNLSIKY